MKKIKRKFMLFIKHLSCLLNFLPVPFSHIKWKLCSKARKCKRFEGELPLLVHGIGLKEGRDSSANFLEIFECYIADKKLNSKYNRKCNSAAIWAAKELGINRNAVYFYGGRAFPELSNPAFFLVNIDNLAKNNIVAYAVPFDTGALREKTVRKIGLGGPRWHYLQYRVRLNKLKKYFTHYLSVCFDKPDDYVDGFPNQEFLFFDEEKYDNLHTIDWRNWTVEVHSSAVPLQIVEKVVINQSFYNFLNGSNSRAASKIQSYIQELNQNNLLEVCESDDAEGYIDENTRARLAV